MLKDQIQERISELEKIKKKTVAERSALMAQVEAKEGYIEIIDAKLDELIWVEKDLAESKAWMPTPEGPEVGNDK